MPCRKQKYLNPTWPLNNSLKIWMLTLQSILCVCNMYMQYTQNIINMDTELKTNNRSNAKIILYWPYFIPLEE